MKFYKRVSEGLEVGYYIKSGELDSKSLEIIHQLLQTDITETSLEGVELFPRMVTPWSTNCVNILERCGVKVERVEKFYRGKVEDLPEYDPMLFCVGLDPDKSILKKEVVLDKIPIDELTIEWMMNINDKYHLGMSREDLELYYQIFKEDSSKTFVTDIELFDLSQSNSEHSRHWFFRGDIYIDGEKKPSLMKLVRSTLTGKTGQNSLVAFKDNSSVIRGSDVMTYTVDYQTGKLEKKLTTLHPIFTAETHNFPTGISPFPGATTGTGGRIRDVQACGRGAFVVAGTAGYCVGNLEREDAGNVALPKRILIEASNGASDYGNKFGEPLIQGFARSYHNDELGVEWVKPIMFTGGVGMIQDRDLYKKNPEEGDLVVKIGGPAYRIGIGGGSASSMGQGENNREADFNAVQRGDPEMEQKMNRVIRTCLEMSRNPILSIHDQGAGGNGNVIKEIVSPVGAIVDLNEINLGDPTMNALEIWNSEYQEQNAFLVKPTDKELIEGIAKRENVSVEFVGEVVDTGRITVSHQEECVVDLDLDKVLENVPMKEYHLTTPLPSYQYLSNSDRTKKIFSYDAIYRVLSSVCVGSKRYLTNKVDRSVTGLIVQQQCVGPFHTPLSNVAVVAHSYKGHTGTATAIGERPILANKSVESMVYHAVGEMLTNIVWAKVTRLEDIKCSTNWMWPLKKSGQVVNEEGYYLYQAGECLANLMEEIGIGIDGGKDSLSMSARVDEKTINSPRTLVVSGYAMCPNTSKIVTPDLKPVESSLLLIDLDKNYTLDGTVLAQVYQINHWDAGCQFDVMDLKKAFKRVQELIDKGLVLAGHDRSDGGLYTTLLEMSFAGGLGFDIDLPNKYDQFRTLYSEGLGLVLQISNSKLKEVLEILGDLPVYNLGQVRMDTQIIINYHNSLIVDGDLDFFLSSWEKTSYEMEKLQCNPECVEEEWKALVLNRERPQFKFEGFEQFSPFEQRISLSNRYRHLLKNNKVAVIREEGSNGDREMMTAFDYAGFEVYDVNMNDLLEGTKSLDQFRGIAFVGGFSYADVLGAGQGWSRVILNNERVRNEFDRFYQREDTFSLGVCNGCQMMSLLGWVGDVKFVENKSGRFESRMSTVKILENKNIFLRDLIGSVIPIWVAHGEGRAVLNNKVSLDPYDEVKFPIRYTDPQGNITEKYPYNPNGSVQGIAAVSSENGRHLAMMPHPERSFLLKQLPYNPENWKASPWYYFFKSAYNWCHFMDS